MTERDLTSGLLAVNLLRITNRFMDDKCIHDIFDLLVSGKLKMQDLGAIYVHAYGHMKRYDYYVVDGNHRTAAMKMAGIKLAQCEIYVPR